MKIQLWMKRIQAHHLKGDVTVEKHVPAPSARMEKDGMLQSPVMAVFLTKFYFPFYMYLFNNQSLLLAIKLNYTKKLKQTCFFTIF